MAENSSPAILPISNPEHVALAPLPISDSQQMNSSTPSSARAFFSNISNIVRSGLADRRPWKELLDRSAFSKPESISEATGRFRKNYNYFRVNYLIVAAAILAFSLVTNPMSLILVTGLLAAWMFLYFFRHPSDSPVTFCGRQFSDFEILVFLIISSFIVVFLTNVGSVLMTALMLGTATICCHGAFRTPEDMFLDENPQQQGIGFFPFVAAATVPQPPVAAKA